MASFTLAAFVAAVGTGAGNQAPLAAAPTSAPPPSPPPVSTQAASAETPAAAQTQTVPTTTPIASQSSAVLTTTVGRLAEGIAAGWPQTTYRRVQTSVPSAGSTPTAGLTSLTVTDEVAYPESVHRRVVDSSGITTAEFILVDRQLFARGSLIPEAFQTNTSPDTWVQFTGDMLEPGSTGGNVLAQLQALFQPRYSGLGPEEEDNEATLTPEMTVDGRSCFVFTTIETTQTGERLDVDIALTAEGRLCSIATTGGGLDIVETFTFDVQVTISAPTEFATPANRTPTIGPTPTPDLRATIASLETQVASLGPTPTSTATVTPTATAALDASADLAAARAAADVCVSRGNLRCPVEVFVDALARHPDDQVILAALYLAYLAYGESLEFRTDLDGAQENYQRAYDLDPSRDAAVAALDRIAPYAAILFADDFETIGGFNEVNRDGVETFYRDGTFSFRISEGGGAYFPVSSVLFGSQPFAAVAECRVARGGYCMLVFGATAEETFYFAVQPVTGRWHLSLFEGSANSRRSLAGGIAPVTAADEYLPIEVRNDGNRARLLVGGEEVDNVYIDPTAQVGQVGFGAAPDDATTASSSTVTFDSVIVYRLES